MIRKVLLFALNIACLSTFGQENKKVSDSLLKSVNIKAGALTFTELMADKPGIQVIQSGTIGAASQLMIRGLGSINLNSSPYIYM
ncbi:hypothetical protein [Pedobacter heparinus]|uniref:hypothetical protein n=1 Tax=Pedobacter heparinus TaxID=984 RepID=UPI000AF8C758|nr:hypothetical protein [Pedobacter heparinus]